MKNISLNDREIQDKIIELAAEKMVEQFYEDASQRLHTAIRGSVEKQIAQAIEKELEPIVKKGISSIVFRKTNMYGEEKGPEQTFTEFVAEKAEKYLTEEVNYDGKTRKEEQYSWRGAQTRVAFMVHKHIHYHIEEAMKKALSTANSAIAEGLEKTVKIKLAEISQALKVEVKTR